MRRTPLIWLALLLLASGCGAQTAVTQLPTTVPATSIATVLPSEPVLSPKPLPTASPTSAPTTPATRVLATSSSPIAQENKSTPVVKSTVAITMTGGEQLAGTLYGQGDTVVVLAHQLGGSQLQWSLFANEVAQQGFTALTFDFRGHGNTGGKRHLGELDEDLKAVFAFLGDRGFTKIVCVGASMGGTACLKAAHDPHIVGLVIVSSPLAMQQPLSLRPEDFIGLTFPKLFVVSENDSEVRTHVQAMYDISPEPKQIQVFPGSAHGTDLQGQATHDTFQKLLLDFLAPLR